MISPTSTFYTYNYMNLLEKYNIRFNLYDMICARTFFRNEYDKIHFGCKKILDKKLTKITKHLFYFIDK